MSPALRVLRDWPGHAVFSAGQMTRRILANSPFHDPADAPAPPVEGDLTPPR